ncbi:DUF2059 domain-containing protein [Kamptonema sp. UHCC 0994]|uniref:DUF2059 domain-containing protein n=1 Tax=Kamptonema sp. UHCC 0994 TaxID=3031329 RepID=UPI0023BA55D5|nr:DUF2059 domain-containing protein [Kamptonema sp. UHCC 0994]MDF0556865.1 DUF2059 domain-containing protein [Kamptonema sp. UHCC 0994]
MLKKLTIALGISGLILLLPVGSAFANEAISPEKRVLIEELLAITEADKNINQLMDSMLAQLEQQLPTIISNALKTTSNQSNDDLQQQSIEMARRVIRRYREVLPQKINLAQYVQEVSYSLYAKYFSESELKDLIAFYRTSTGRKTIDVMPRLFAESMQQFNEKLLPEMMNIMKEIVEDEIGKTPTINK